MRFEELAETETYKQYWVAMLETENMEFWVLKTQIYIEYRLKQLLAFRLGVQGAAEESFIKQFETIQYRHLILLALAGTNSNRLLSYLEKLNNVRREVAHRFQVSNYLAELETFVSAIRRKEAWSSERTKQISSVRIALAVITTLVDLKIRDVEKPEQSTSEYDGD